MRASRGQKAGREREQLASAEGPPTAKEKQLDVRSLTGNDNECYDILYEIGQGAYSKVQPLQAQSFKFDVMDDVLTHVSIQFPYFI